MRQLMEMESTESSYRKKKNSVEVNEHIHTIIHHGSLQLTWGGVGVDVGLPMGGVGFLLPPPDIISSVMSLPPWFGSLILIYKITIRHHIYRWGVSVVDL